MSGLFALRLGLVLAFAVATGIDSAARQPSPSLSPPPAGARVHLHRPGTEIEADSLQGNLESKRYTVSGNVVLHEDPKLDKAVDLSETESDQPIELHADRMSVDERNRRYAAHGSVRFTQAERSGFAQDATLDDRSHDLDLSGGARVADGGRSLAADTIHYNTKTRVFAGDGNVEIIAPLPTNPPGTPAPKKRRRLPALPL